LVLHREVAKAPELALAIGSTLLDLLTPVRAELALVDARIERATDTDQPRLTEAFATLLAGGKRLRPALALLSAGEDRAGSREVVALGAALEMLHTATLIHDDIVDGADLRRGRPTMASLHGRDAALLAGDHLFARAAVVVTETGDLEALRVFAQTLVTISAGELAQVWRQSRLPSLEEYLSLIYAKTACLFESATLGGALLAGRKREEVQRFADYGRNLGLAFQIADDVLDYAGDAAVMGKPTQNDLKRGLLTLPVLLYVWEHPDWASRELPSSVPQRTVRRVVRAVLEGGFVEKAREMARDYAERARESVSGLAGGEYATSLEGLAYFASERVA